MNPIELAAQLLSESLFILKVVMVLGGLVGILGLAGVARMIQFRFNTKK